MTPTPLAKFAFAAALMTVAAAAAQAGQVYKWVDQNGRVHFSDTPRPGWTPVDMKSAPSLSAGSAEGEAAADGEAGAQGNGTAPANGAGADRARLRAEECRNRKEQLQSYRNASTIVERDALGKEKRYSEEERLQLIEQTQKQVAELCGPEVQ